MPQAEDYETRIQPFVIAAIHNDMPRWSGLLSEADVDTLIEVLAHLGRPDWAHKREAVRSMIEAKLTRRTIREMRRLEKVGLGLAVVGVFVAVPSMVIAVRQIGESSGWW